MWQRDKGGRPMADKKHAKLLDLIPEGRGNAISMKDLAGLLNCTVREVRKAVFNARIDGEVICGTDAGYYLPATREELKEYYTLRRGAALSSLKALKGARIRLAEFSKAEDGKKEK